LLLYAELQRGETAYARRRERLCPSRGWSSIPFQFWFF
jgi:hypothetical protein